MQKLFLPIFNQMIYLFAFIAIGYFLAKLVLYPLFFILICILLTKNVLDRATIVCACCITCMPVGLNAIVVPAGYGKDTSDAAGMALITHLFSVITIPLMFILFETIIG